MHEIIPDEDDTESTQQAQQPPPQQKVFVQKAHATQGVILVESVPQKSTERGLGKTQPVDPNLRDKKRFYCENCKSNFVCKDLLAGHIKNDCLQVVHRFICDGCHIGFYSEDAVREHYFRVHLNQHLYFCTKCNEGFFYKSRKSSHKKGGGCPNAGGENQYPTRAAIDPALAATFKWRRQVPMTITEADPTPEPEAPQQQPDPALPIPPEPLAGTSEQDQAFITGEPIIQNPEQVPLLGEPILGGEPGQILENLRHGLGLTEEGTDPSLLLQQGADALMVAMSQRTLIESATGEIVKPEPVTGEEGMRGDVTEEPTVMLDLDE